MALELSGEEEMPRQEKCCSKGKLQITAGIVSTFLGGFMLFSITLWFASAETSALSPSTDVFLALGILCGIFQFGSTQILFLCDIKSKWHLFVWFSLPSYFGATATFITFLLHYLRVDEMLDDHAILTEELTVVMSSGLNCAFNSLFLVVSIAHWIMGKVTSREVQYDLFS